VIPGNACSGIPCHRILVVDPDDATRRLIGRLLIRHGYLCRLAPDASAALAELDDADFDLVLTDVDMPGLPGLDLLRQVHERCPDTAVVLLTGVDHVPTAVKALEGGAFGYVLKPVRENEVVIGVKNALHRLCLEVENRSYRERLEEKVREQTEETRMSQKEVALRLVIASEYRDNETGAHIRRIGLYCEVLGELLGMHRDLREQLGLAAAMHDIGKVGIPDAILRKPGRLTPDEAAVMQRHPEIGASILGGTSIALVRMAREISLGHHERWDGNGYPARLRGNAIPLPARIASVMDVYDALTHPRVYKAAWPEEQAVDEMLAQRGAQFDPEVLDLFSANLHRFREVRLANPDV
jgi:putative two-component system response regulator